MMQINKLISSGLLIVFEGIDGTGKSTQCSLLEQALSAEGYVVHADKEPTDQKYGALVRQSSNSGRFSPEQELEYFHLDRKMHVEQLIRPALDAGEIVILDRYYFSTMAYQGQRGFDPQQLRQENESFAPQPDLLFVLDLPVETSLERIGTRGDTANAFEQKDSLKYCRDTFLSIVNEPFAHLLDAQMSIEHVHAAVFGIVQTLLKRRQASEGN